MTLVLELPPEVERAARELAAEKGETLETLVIEAVRGLARRREDGLLAFLESCPEDDEPETEEERERVRQAWDEYHRGAVISHEEVTGSSGLQKRSA